MILFLKYIIKFIVSLSFEILFACHYWMLLIYRCIVNNQVLIYRYLKFLINDSPNADGVAQASTQSDLRTTFFGWGVNETLVYKLANSSNCKLFTDTFGLMMFVLGNNWNFLSQWDPILLNSNVLNINQQSSLFIC